MKSFLLKHRILSYLIGLALSYILFSPLVLGFLYDRLLFYPDRNYYPECAERLEKITSPYGVKVQDLYIPVRGQNALHSWYFKKYSAGKTFIISHGNAGNICHRLHLVKTLLPHGSVLLYDYEGYGQSEGSPSRKSVCEDGVAAYDYLVNHESIKPEDIILYGESLGCGVSCEISKCRKIGGIILQSPWESLLGAARDRFLLLCLYPDCLFAQPLMDNGAVLARAHAPLLLIHGVQDKILPCRYSQSLYKHALSPKQIVLLPNAAHNDVGFVDVQLYAQSIDQFLKFYFPAQL